MKKIAFLLSFFMLGGLVTQAQEVGTDHELHSNIENYKTYSWSKDIDQIPSDQVFVGKNGVLVFNNESTRSKIKDAIQYELSARGYKQVDNNPDFLVTYMVLEQPAELVTYEGYQTLYNGMDTVRTEENVQRTQVESGTLLINFIDFKSSKKVWQGYASGSLKPEMANDDAKVRGAISSIFSEYQYKAQSH